MTCTKCKIKAKKRSTAPYTASPVGKKYFDYFQCPKYKANYAKQNPEKMSRAGW